MVWVFWGMVAVWVVRWMKLAVRVIITAVGRRWYRGLMVMLRVGRVIVVGSAVSVGMARVMMYWIMIVRVMKRRMVSRFLGVVQWSMRRFWGGVVILFVRLWFCF